VRAARTTTGGDRWHPSPPPAASVRSATWTHIYSGEILRPGDRGYAAARRLWNSSIDRHLAAIPRPRTAGDVATAALHARQVGLEIAVRGGGHSTAGHSMSNGGVTIDLCALRAVTVEGARVVRGSAAVPC